MSNNNPKPLTPSEYLPPDESTSASSTIPPARVEKILWLGVFVAVTLVFGWLISVVLSPDETVEPVLVAPVQEQQPASQETAAPFEQAAEQQARQQAQQILSQLLDERAWLQQALAEQWAARAFADLGKLGDEGDLLYEQRAYQQALETWTSALAQARQLREQAVDIAAQRGLAAEQSLANDALSQAQNQIEVALAIQPDSSKWQSIAMRIEQRPELQELLTQAEQQMARREHETAVQQLEAVISRDAEYSRAANLLQQARMQRSQQAFATAIADALFAIEQRRFEDARNHLETAGQWDAQNPALIDARLQLEAAQHDSQVIGARQNAEAAEVAETWGEAIAAWQEVERLSPGSTEALIGLIRASARAELDSRVKATLEDPLKLREPNAWNSAESLLGEAKVVRDPGPLLQQQIQDLARAIRVAREPVTLVVQSDGLTDLRINGVGRIGTTTQTELELYPGRYSLVGTRSGFQDVFEQIVIDGEQPRMEVYLAATREVPSQ